MTADELTAFRAALRAVLAPMMRAALSPDPPPEEPPVSVFAEWNRAKTHEEFLDPPVYLIRLPLYVTKPRRHFVLTLNDPPPPSPDSPPAPGPG